MTDFGEQPETKDGRTFVNEAVEKTSKDDESNFDAWFASFVTEQDPSAITLPPKPADIMLDALADNPYTIRSEMAKDMEKKKKSEEPTIEKPTIEKPSTFIPETTKEPETRRDAEKKVEVCVGSETKEFSEEELAKRKQEVIETIRAQVAEMEANGNCRLPLPENYLKDSDERSIYLNYVISTILIPSKFLLNVPTNEYINSITAFKYNAFDSPNFSMSHTIPEKVIYLNKINDIFGHVFMEPSDQTYKFTDIDVSAMEFIGKHSDKGTTKLEYAIIRSMLGKLIISLNTTCESAMRDNERPTIDAKFKQVVLRDINIMKKIQSTNGKMNMSWKIFLESLMSINSENAMYVHKNNTDLNNKLSTAYGTDFLTEHLLGSMLKCYIPSIALNYFYVIKSVYIIARMVSLYIQLDLSKNRSLEQVVEDLFVIGTFGTMMYENKTFILKNTPRTLPTYSSEISEQTKAYILNHILVGGQYYILKMLEKSLPVVAKIVKQ